nr:hypothetical protein Itr_chr11CG22980 [Ipomoea trifida]
MSCPQSPWAARPVTTSGYQSRVEVLGGVTCDPKAPQPLAIVVTTGAPPPSPPTRWWSSASLLPPGSVLHHLVPCIASLLGSCLLASMPAAHVICLASSTRFGSNIFPSSPLLDHTYPTKWVLGSGVPWPL